MKYKVEITETLQRIVEVKANSLSDAVTKVAKDYSDGKIVLDSGDFVEFKILEYKEKKNDER